MAHLIFLLIFLSQLTSLFSQTNQLTNNVQPPNTKPPHLQYNQALEAIFGMGIRLQVLLDNSASPNFVVSPMSTVVVIAQLMIGAEGELQDHLYELLSLPKLSSPAYTLNYYSRAGVANGSYALPYAQFHLQLSGLVKAMQRRKGTADTPILDQNNAWFYSQHIALDEKFRKSLEKFYATEVRPVDFRQDTRSTINMWASANTNGLINDIISYPPPPTTSSILLNSVYFKADWEQPFPDEFNRLDKFYIGENMTVDTTYMLTTMEQIPYAETSDFKLITLPYKGREYGMYIIYPLQNNPYKYNIKKFVEEVNPQLVYQALANVKNKDVIVKIPKLSLSNTLNLLRPLEKYIQLKKDQQQAAATTRARLSLRISPRVDDAAVIQEIQNKIHLYKNYTSPVYRDVVLTAAAKDAQLKVSSIVQQMVFSINEKGTEAAAVTAGVTDYIGGQKVVVLNRPFCFFIRHEATSATIFWGTISDPSKS